MIQTFRRRIPHTVILAFVAVVLAIAGGFWFLNGTGVLVSKIEYQDDISLEIGIWRSGQSIAQTFTASQNRLSRVDFRFDSYHPWDVPSLECTLFEIVPPDEPFPTNLTNEWLLQHAQAVRHTRLNGWFLSGHMFNQFAFEPITDSQGRRYALGIQAPEVHTGGSSILLASRRERYEEGRFYINGDPQPGDLAFRAIYRQPRLEILRDMLARFPLQKPAPFANPVTYIVLFGGYLGGVAVWLLLLMRLAFGHPARPPMLENLPAHEQPENKGGDQ